MFGIGVNYTHHTNTHAFSTVAPLRTDVTTVCQGACGEMAARSVYTNIGLILLLPSIRVLVERWPLDQRPWTQFLMGSGAQSQLRDYLKPPALGTAPRNHLPRLYQVRTFKSISLRLHLINYSPVSTPQCQCLRLSVYASVSYYVIS